MAEQTLTPLRRRPARGLPWPVQLAIAALLALLAAGGVVATNAVRHHEAADADKASGSAAATAASAESDSGAFRPTAEQLAAMTIRPVEQRTFRTEESADGKIAIDEDRATPVFSPYAGKVTRLFVKPGDRVARGAPLFAIEASDMVQAQNDDIGAITALSKARSQLNLAQTSERRQRDLYEAKAVARKDWEQSQADLSAAQNDVRAAETALGAARNRLRILGKTDQEVATFESKGTISPETVITAPIDGIVTQRKVGPGQYISTGATDPVYTIGDLSTAWLIANVRETDAPKVHPGDAVEVRVLAYPDRVFNARITYVAPTVDPQTRRLPVRAEVENADGMLKPEMFASFAIVTGADVALPAVPQEAVVYEGDKAHVWVARDNGSIVARDIEPGRASDGMIAVRDGLKSGEKIVTRGGLFIDRATASAE
ncbi:MAG TPA: efflux RND transporter periplasmic adaptor subunit [Stellaceae bacterium]